MPETVVDSESRASMALLASGVREPSGSPVFRTSDPCHTRGEGAQVFREFNCYTHYVSTHTDGMHQAKGFKHWEFLRL